MNPVNRFFTITFINRKTTDNQANKLMAWLLAVSGSLECTPDLALHFLDDMLNMLSLPGLRHVWNLQGNQNKPSYLDDRDNVSRS